MKTQTTINEATLNYVKYVEEIEHELETIRTTNAELLAALKEVYSLRSHIQNAIASDKERYGSISHSAAKFELARAAIANAEREG